MCEQQHGQHQKCHRSPAAASSNGIVGIASAKPLDFRILTEPIAMRPNKGAYGVPYDLVDTSQGSALSDMLQQIQEANSALAAMNILGQGIKAEE